MSSSFFSQSTRFLCLGLSLLSAASLTLTANPTPAAAQVAPAVPRPNSSLPAPASTWQNISGTIGQVGQVYARGNYLYATSATNNTAITGNIYQYNNSNGKGTWTQIGGPGKEFVVDDAGNLYGITPDGSAVWEYTPASSQWQPIGYGAAHLYAGGNSVFAIDPNKGTIAQYQGTSYAWTQIGNPGKEFVVDDSGNLYGISPSGSEIWKYDGAPNQWTQIDANSVTHLYAGGNSLYKTDANGEVYQYNNGTTWIKLTAAPGQKFTVGSFGQLYNITTNGQALYEYKGSNATWTQLSVPAVNGVNSVSAGAATLYVIDSGQNLLQTLNAYTVSSTADDSSGKTLRDMVNLVNTSGGGTIVFDPNVFTGGVETITLTQGQLNFNSNMAIVGPNQGVTISGNNVSGVLYIPSGATVSLSHLTITQGNFSATPSLMTPGGGGIDNNGTLTLTNSTISGNTANVWGGGIWNAGTLTLLNSTISGNKVNLYGGGIANAGTLKLTNSTISGNTAGNDGGGIINATGTAILLNDTIVLNQAETTGGIDNEATLNIANSLIAGNTANNNESDLNGNLAANVNNLISPTQQLSSIINITLAMNGAPFGSPLTHALVTNSPAIDSGNNSPSPVATFGSLPTTDERGQPRINNGTVDIGAFEF